MSILIRKFLLKKFMHLEQRVKSVERNDSHTKVSGDYCCNFKGRLVLKLILQVRVLQLRRMRCWLLDLLAFNSWDCFLLDIILIVFIIFMTHTTRIFIFIQLNYREMKAIYSILVLLAIA